VPDDFTRFAKRGLFAYDWQDVHRVSYEKSGCYELVARPTRKLADGRLPPDLARLAGLTRLQAITFEEATMIDLANYVTVVDSSDE
jgi:hypothetical protein